MGWTDIRDKVTGSLFGKQSGQKLPSQYRYDPATKLANREKELTQGIAAPTKGSTLMSDAVDRMKSGLSGYTSPEYAAMKNKASRDIESAYGQASSAADMAAVKGGLGGGFQAKMNARLDQAKAGQLANLSQDLMIKDIDEQQNRLKDFYTASGNLGQEELQRRQFAEGLAQQEEANKQWEYQSMLQRYGLDPKTESGGLLGLVADKAIPGLSGVYKDFRFG